MVSTEKLDNRTSNLKPRVSVNVPSPVLVLWGRHFVLFCFVFVSIAHLLCFQDPGSNGWNHVLNPFWHSEPW